MKRVDAAATSQIAIKEWNDDKVFVLMIIG